MVYIAQCLNHPQKNQKYQTNKADSKCKPNKLNKPNHNQTPDEKAYKVDSNNKPDILHL